MNGLADFLLARIAEDEAVAIDASRSTGAANWGAQSYKVVVGDFEVGEANVQSAAHMARHDPARVLAEVAAKRAIVEECVPVWVRVRYRDSQAARALLHLASVYRDHPDYDEGWAL